MDYSMASSSESGLEDSKIQETLHVTQDENQPDEDLITVFMINDDGYRYRLSNVSQDIRISDLMKKSFERFYKNQKKSVFKYNVISVRSNNILRTFQTVKQNELVHNDELLLVERYVTQEELMDDAAEQIFTQLKSRGSKVPHANISQVPNRANIDEVTKKMKTKNKKKRKSIVNKSPYCNPFVTQIELHLTLLALIVRSANLISTHDVSVVVDEVVKKAGLHMKPDKVLLSKLISMGYGMEISQTALVLSDNNVPEAIEWLVTESPSVTTDDLYEFNSLRDNCETENINSNNFSEFIMAVMKYLMKKQELSCAIFEEFLDRIKDLGFTDENQVRRALRKSFNEINRACLLLLGEPVEDISVTGSKWTSFVDKILSDPENLAALSNKKMLLSLVDFFADPSDDGTNWHLVKIVEAFETEKFFSHGCINNVLVFF